MSLLAVKKLRKTYSTRFGANKVEPLRDVNFTIESGEYVAIMGESGSGKTTLLNLIASLDKPSSGEIYLNNENISTIKNNKLAEFRRENLGFVFQEFNLLDTFNIKDNILLPLVLRGEDYRNMEKKLNKVSKELSINELLDKYPYEISGGQKQRVAVARALITEPQLILADEPTGALDSKSSDELLRLFRKINELDQTLLMVTHSVKAASTANRILFIKDGKVFHQIYRGDDSDQELFKKISDTLVLLSKGEINAD